MAIRRRGNEVLPGNWYLGAGIWDPCFGPYCILRGQNPLIAWYLGLNTSSLAVRINSRNVNTFDLKLI
jgi:hypothetical protein